MSERPFMQLYVSDFLGDTLHLNTEQIGAYMLLLMAMWNAGGRLPADDAKLARVARMSLKKWRAVAGDLMPFFEAGDDTISHNRLTKELQKSESKSQSRASAGAKGGSAKALKDKETTVANATVLLQHLPDTRYQKEEEPLRGRGASDDVRKVLFDEGVDLLGRRAGVPERKTRGLIGKWLRDAGDDAGKVLAKLRQADADDVVDIVAWVTKALQPKAIHWRDEPEYRGVL